MEDTDKDPKCCFLAPLVVLAAVSFPPPRSAFANNNIAQLLLPFFVVQEDVVTIIEKRNTKTKKLLLFVVKLNIVALIIVSSTTRRRRKSAFSPETLPLSLFFASWSSSSSQTEDFKETEQRQKSCLKSCIHRFSACVLGVFLVRSFLHITRTYH